MEIRELVGGTATVCGLDLTVAEAASTMESAGIGSIGVIDDGELVGIITERDIVRAVSAGVDLGATVIREWMTPDPDSLSPDVDVRAAAEWLLATGYRHLPVVDGGALIGIVSIKDVLWATVDPR
jgi:CBS domain-containing protein